MADNQKRKSKNRVPVALLFFRALIGLYLMWLGWGLRGTALSGKEGSLPILAAMILFIAVGGWLTAVSVIKYQRREFLLPGSEDMTEEEIQEAEQEAQASAAEDPEK